MKKIYSIIIMGLIGISLINAQPLDSAKNGGFESSNLDASTAANWFFTGDKPANMTTTIVAEHHSGEKGLKVVITNRDAISGVQAWTLQIVNEQILVEKNKAYRISIWSRGETEEESFNFTAGNNKYAEIGRLSGVVLTSEWTKYVFVASSGENDTIRTPIHLLTNGTYYFDDLSVVKSPMKSAVTNDIGNKVTVKFEWNINFDASSLSTSAFTVKVNGTAVAINSYAANSSTGIDILLGSKIKPGDNVSISYDDNIGNITFTSGLSGAVDAFTDETVDNLSDGSSSISSAENIFSVYPNPVENEINLKGVNGTYKYSISNYLGQLVMSGQSSGSIDAKGLERGLYFITISTSNGENSVTKFLKK